jgi:hypothetical protein
MNLKTSARLLLAACLAAALPSCTGIPGEYGGAPYGGGYGSYDSYGDGGGYSSYSSRPVFGGGGYGGGYYGGGYSQPYYPGYRSSRYSHDDHDHYSSNRRDYDRGHSSSSHRDSDSRSSSSSEAIRLVKVRDGTRGSVPEGYHSKEYFKNRGISLSKNVYETRDGDRRGHSSSNSDSKKKKR